MAIAAILGIPLILTITPVMQAPAQAAPETPSIDIVIDGLTPVVPKKKGTLKIVGRLVNISGSTIEDVAVQLHLSNDSLGLRSEVNAVAVAGLFDPVDDQTHHVKGTRATIALAMTPGQQQSFTISVPILDLSLPHAGAYALSIEALGVVPGVDQAEGRKGMKRTFLPWFPKGSVPTPLNITWLWPLAGAPARNAEGVLLDDRIPVELAQGGRLSNLVNIGGGFPNVVTWVADPELLQTASSMSTGYLVQSAGTTVVGDNSLGASQWLETLAKALLPSPARMSPVPTMVVVPYADIDAIGARRAGLVSSVDEAITIAPGIARSILDSKVTGILYWAPNGRIDKETASLLTAKGVATVVLSARVDTISATGSHPDTATISTPSGALTTLLVDPDLSSLITTKKLSQDDVISDRQLFLVETGIMSTAAETGGLVIAPTDVRWDPDQGLVSSLLRAMTKAPWLRPSSYSDLVTGASSTRERTTYGEALKRGELPPDYLQLVERVHSRLTLFTSILDDPLSVSLPYSQALLRAQSSAWRGDLTTGKAIIKQTNTALQEQISKVRALTSGTMIFSGDAGRVPITLTNDLTQTVTVGLQLVGSPPVRLESEPITDIVIEPGHRVSVEVDARVIGSDPLLVKVQLLTQSGSPYGSDSTISLTSTAYSRAAAWVVGVAFAAIVVFVIVGVIRRIMKVRATVSSAGRANPDVDADD